MILLRQTAKLFTLVVFAGNDRKLWALQQQKSIRLQTYFSILYV